LQQQQQQPNEWETFFQAHHTSRVYKVYVCMCGRASLLCQCTTRSTIWRRHRASLQPPPPTLTPARHAHTHARAHRSGATCCWSSPACHPPPTCSAWSRSARAAALASSQCYVRSRRRALRCAT
jgi:hypothetical protein